MKYYLEKTHRFVYAGLPSGVYILFAANIVNRMGSYILTLITLILTQKIGLSKWQSGMFITLFMLTQIPCMLFGGRLIDRVGRKPVIVFCSVTGALLYLICALLRPSLLLALLIGIASDFFMLCNPAYDSLVADLTPTERRQNAFSLMYLGTNIGFAVSPLVAGALFDRYLSLLFVLDAGSTVLASLLTVFLVRQHSRAEVIPETAQLSEVEERNAANPGLAKPAGTCLSSGNPHEPLRRILLHAPVLTIYLACLCVYQFCYAQWGFILPLQMNDYFHSAGAADYTYLISFNALLVILLTVFFTQLLHRCPPLYVTAAGGLLYTAAFIGFGLAVRMPGFFVSSALLTFGEIIITINISAFIANHSPATHLGRVNSFASLLQGVSTAFGPALMGLVLDRSGYCISWLVIAGFIFAGSVGMFLLGRSKPARTDCLRAAVRSGLPAHQTAD